MTAAATDQKTDEIILYPSKPFILFSGKGKKIFEIQTVFDFKLSKQ